MDNKGQKATNINNEILDVDREMFKDYPNFEKIEEAFESMKHLTKDKLMVESMKAKNTPVEDREPFWEQKQIAITFLVDALAQSDDSALEQASLDAIKEGHKGFISLSEKSGLLADKS